MRQAHIHSEQIHTEQIKVCCWICMQREGSHRESILNAESVNDVQLKIKLDGNINQGMDSGHSMQGLNVI